MVPAYLWKWRESVRLEAKGTAQAQYTLVRTVVSVGTLVNDSESSVPAH